MQKKVTTCCLACILVAALILSGCSGNKQAQETSAKPENQVQTQTDTRVKDQPQTEAQTQPQKQADTPAVPSSDRDAPTGVGEVATLLAKAQKINEISFEYAVIEGKEKVAAGKAWVKGNRSKNEIAVDGETMISIYDTAKAEAYLYIVGEEMATLSELTPEMAGWFQTPTNFYDDLDVSLVKIVDTETYDGHKCKVMAIVDETGWEESRVWVSEEYGIPLRIQTDDAMGLIIMEYKNVKIGSVPDSALELPPGVEISDLRPPK